MKKMFAIAAGLLMLVACAQKNQKSVSDNEPTTITCIEDKPGPSMQTGYSPMFQTRCGKPSDCRMVYRQA